MMTSLIQEGVKELQSYFDQNSPNMLKASVMNESETQLITTTDTITIMRLPEDIQYRIGHEDQLNFYQNFYIEIKLSLQYSIVLIPYTRTDCCLCYHCSLKITSHSVDFRPI